jgi:hypothetical protein
MNQGAKNVLVPLPEKFNPYETHQFRIIHTPESLSVWYEDTHILEQQTAAGEQMVGVWVHHAALALDMVRVTAY